MYGTDTTMANKAAEHLNLQIKDNDLLEELDKRGYKVVKK